MVQEARVKLSYVVRKYGVQKINLSPKDEMRSEEIRAEGVYSLFGQKVTRKRSRGKMLWLTNDETVIAEGFLLAHLQARRGARTQGEVLSKLKQVYPGIKFALEITKFFPEAFQKEGFPGKESWKELLQNELKKLEEKSHEEEEDKEGSSDSESSKASEATSYSVKGAPAKGKEDTKETIITIKVPKGASVSIIVK